MNFCSKTWILTAPLTPSIKDLNALICASKARQIGREVGRQADRKREREVGRQADSSTEKRGAESDR